MPHVFLDDTKSKEKDFFSQIIIMSVNKTSKFERSFMGAPAPYPKAMYSYKADPVDKLQSILYVNFFLILAIRRRFLTKPKRLISQVR